jgi:hypothetical protein
MAENVRRILIRVTMIMSTASEGVSFFAYDRIFQWRQDQEEISTATTVCTNSPVSVKECASGGVQKWIE